MDERMRFVTGSKTARAWPPCAASLDFPQNRLQDLERYEECGLEGLTDRASAPTAMPTSCPSKSKPPS